MSKAAEIKKTHFAGHLAAGKSQTEAAQAAGYKGRQIRKRASKLAKDDFVLAELARLKKADENRARVARAKYVARLTDLLKNGETPTREVIAAGQEMGKLFGWYTPNKIEHSGQIGGLEHMTDAELDARIKELEAKQRKQ